MRESRIQPAAVIFDYGNVLCRPQDRADVEALAAMLRLPVAQFSERYWKTRLAYDEAALDPRSYWEGVAQRSLATSEIEHLNEIDSRSWANPDPVMPDWARRVRDAGLRTALLSNMPIPVRDYVQSCDWLPEFDQRVFSCDLRKGKPAREVFEHCLRGLQVAPSEALLLDDRPENVSAAMALGMHAILFTTPIELATALHRSFALPVSLIATVDSGDEKNK